VIRDRYDGYGEGKNHSKSAALKCGATLGSWRFSCGAAVKEAKQGAPVKRGRYDGYGEGKRHNARGKGKRQEP